MFGGLQVCKYILMWEHGAPQLHEDRSSCTQNLSRPLYLFTWRFLKTLYHILCNNSVYVSKLLLCVSWALIASYQYWGEGYGNPLICSQSNRSVGNLTSIMGAVLWCLHQLWFDGARIELNCRTPSWCQQRIGEFLDVENPHICCHKHCE